MGQFIKIAKEEIAEAFVGERRQYFVGDLKKPQNLRFLFSENVEVALTSYDSNSIEPAHRHSVAKEYQYMVSGRTWYIDADTKEVHEFKEGDFFTVYPGTAYAQKAEAGTKILVIKEPSINDKEMVEMDKEVKNFLGI
ncbi:MAG: hypothetical protein LUF92_17380 [Clostridiales bacterium]|nr:hypothetical protein [Clostridiales bacterium]